MRRPPHFFGARAFVDDAMTAVARAAAQLRVEGNDRQHPYYYRANQFWRQLDEFRTELARQAGIPERRRG